MHLVLKVAKPHAAHCRGLQVEELRDAGADEFNRRLSIEATLRQAAALFKRELACKSDEVAGLQQQLRAMRHELTSSNACGAAAVAAAGAARHAAAAAGGSCAGSPCGSPGSPYCAAAGAASPAAAAYASYGGSYQGAAGTAGGSVGAASPAAAAAGADAGAAAAVAAELQVLRSSRASYQNALLQQQAMRNSLLSSLGDCMEVSDGSTSNISMCS